MLDSSNQRNSAVFVLTAIVVALPSTLYVLGGEADPRLAAVLAVQGRVSMALYFLIVAIRPLRQLLAVPATASLLRNRRYFGIALATAMIVHLSFIAWRFAFVRGEHIDVSGYLTGSLFYTIMILMLVTSFDRPAAAFGPRAWRWLHRSGLLVLGIFFVVALQRDLHKSFDEPVYAVLAVLGVAAFALRIAAFLKRRSGSAGGMAARTG